MLYETPSGRDVSAEKPRIEEITFLPMANVPKAKLSPTRYFALVIYSITVFDTSATFSEAYCDLWSVLTEMILPSP